MGEFFRANVGAVIADRAGRVLAFRRARVAGEAWQLPQGGIEPGETPLAAVYREVKEETGIDPQHLEPLAETAGWLTYELPEQYRSSKTGRGQTQKWFLFRFTGSDRDIRPDAREFAAFRWMSAAELVTAVVAFRRPVYEQLLREFAPKIPRPAGTG
jgi:putative (di)nucleoside polyphosphate hydrolase